jgi:hypothetical protein
LRIEVWRNRPDPVAVDPMAIRLPKRGMLRSKLDKQYSVGNTPLESLLYFGAGCWLLDGAFQTATLHGRLRM